MASTKEFVAFVAEQLLDAGQITYRRMFGEYGLYCNGKFFAVICDNQLFVKVTEAARARFPDLPLAPPYEGAKPYFLIEDLDNRLLLAELTAITWENLPEPKPKKR